MTYEPVTNPSVPSRANYSEGQLLRKAELELEQDYLVAARRRHATMSHGWGILAGLQLSTENGKVIISPGSALDPLGRLLVVPNTVELALPEQQDEIPIWLVYSEENQTTVPERTRESVRVGPRANLQTQLKETEGESPIYLGALRRETPTGAFCTDSRGRRLAALVGASVHAASRSARIKCAEDFAVSVGGPENFSDALTVSRRGNLHIHGSAAFKSNVRIHPATERAQPGNMGAGFGVSKTSGSARPWQLYRAEMSLADQPSTQNLVFELPGAQGKEDPAALRVALGRNLGNRFQPAFLVSSNGDVTVTGNLQVRGRLIESPITPDPSDPRFIAAIAAGANAGAVDPSLSPLAIHIEPGKSKVHTNVEYELVFENKTRQPVQISQAHIVVTLNGQIQQQAPLPVPNFVLDPNSKHPFPRTIHLPSPGKVEIGVGILAIAANLPVVANAKSDFQVT